MRRVLKHFGLEGVPFGSGIFYMFPLFLLLINWPVEMNFKSGGEFRKRCHFYSALRFWRRWHRVMYV